MHLHILAYKIGKIKYLASCCLPSDVLGRDYEKVHVIDYFAADTAY